MFQSFFQYIRSINSISLTILTAIYFLFGLNFTLIKKTLAIFGQFDDLNPIFMASVPLFFLSAFTLIFMPFIVIYITKPFLIFMLITAACVNYGAYNFGVIFSQDMMLNIFETTPKESTAYLNLKLIIWIFLSGILPSIYIAFVKIEYKPILSEILRKVILIIVASSIIFTIALFFYKDYASIARNNSYLRRDIIPTYYISSIFKYFRNNFFKEDIAYKYIGMDAKRVINADGKKNLLVVIVGETARAQNYQLNGYDRETNQYTSKIDNMLYFKDVNSCGTATAVSLPCMFSLMDRSNYSRDLFDSQDNIVDIINRAGYKQIWLDNNTGCKGLCDNIESYSIDKIDELKCDGGLCDDRIFLDIFDDKAQSLNGKDGVIYLHLLGSHGPSYWQRYPRELAKFQPDCKTSDLQNCTREEIVNSYDNSILLTDLVMAKIIAKLDKYKDIYNTGIIYMSDHGESLGENGIYLHGLPYFIAPEEQFKIPFMAWFSDEMMDNKGIDFGCITKTAEKGGFSHDNLSHILLGLLDIETNVYDAEKDIFNKCIK